MTDSSPPSSMPGPSAPPPSGPFAGRGWILAVIAVLIAVLGLVTIAASLRDDESSPSTASTRAATGQPQASTTTDVPTTTTTTGVEPDPERPPPVVVADGFLLGWWDGEQWVRATIEDEGGDLPPPPDVSGVPYLFVDADGITERAELGPIGEGCYLGTSWGVFDAITEGRVGVPEGYTIRPRPTRTTAPLASDEDAVAAWLRSRGVEDAPVRITRTVIVDVDGDGDEERFVQAASTDRSGTGSYSVILYRYPDPAGLQTVVVGGDVVEPDEADTELGIVVEHRILAVADLDQDGDFELVTHTGYYEGLDVAVSTVTGARIDSVMQTGCGA